MREALRKNVWGHEDDAALIAVDAGIDPSVLSRWMNEGEDNAAKWVNQFIPLLIRLGERGLDLLAYMGEEVRAAHERTQQDEIAEAAKIVNTFMPVMPDLLKAVSKIAELNKKR